MTTVSNDDISCSRGVCVGILLNVTFQSDNKVQFEIRPRVIRNTNLLTDNETCITGRFYTRRSTLFTDVVGETSRPVVITVLSRCPVSR